MRITRFLLKLGVLLLLYSFVIVALMFPFGWVAIVLGAVAIFRKRRGPLHAFGTARWADASDLRDMVNGGNGLIIGEIEDTTSLLSVTKALFDSSVPCRVACQDFLQWRRTPRRKLVRLNKPPHIAVFAPTGAGKGTSFVVPFLLSCTDSCVVVDLKSGELARLTADVRRKMGHTVYLLDPFRLVTQTPSTLNPLEFIDKASPFAIDDCRQISAAMIDRKDEKGDGVHFLDNAEGAIAAICALLVQYGEGELKSLQALCDICSDPESWQIAIQRMCGSDAWGGMLARMGGLLTHLKERELASSISTIARFLRFLSTPAIAESTRSSSFDPAVLRTQKTTVYLILSPDRASRLSQLLRLWIGTLMQGVVKGGLQDKLNVHWIIDEANILGKMEQISDALTIGRGFGLKMQLYYQDLGQLKKCWPDGADQTLLANVAQVYFAVNDNETARYISEHLGKETIVHSSGGSGSSRSSQSDDQGKGSSSYSSSSNDNWQQAGRELLQINEVLTLHERIAITFTPGVPPIWTRLVRYYEPGFGKMPNRLWQSVKSFAGAVFIVTVLGAFAFGVTQVARAKLQNAQGPFGPNTRSIRK